MSKSKHTLVITGSAEQFTPWMDVNSTFIARVSGTFVGTIYVQSRLDENDSDPVNFDSFSAAGQKKSEFKMLETMQYRIGVVASGLTSGSATVTIAK